MVTYPQYGVCKYVYMYNGLKGWHYEQITEWFDDMQTALDICQILQLTKEMPQVNLLSNWGDKIEILYTRILMIIFMVY